MLQLLARAQLPALFAEHVLCEKDALAILSLVAFKWLPSCFVNQLPLTTLLACYDQLVLRYPPAELLVSARPSAGRGGGGGHPSLLDLSGVRDWRHGGGEVVAQRGRRGARRCDVRLSGWCHPRLYLADARQRDGT